MLSLQNLRGAAAVTGVLLMAGCGSSATSSTSSSPSPSPSARGSAPAGPSTASAGALTGEARATATGDIPDNQVFLVLKNQRAGYSIEYPEGWTQHGAGDDVTFQNSNNLVHVTVARGPVPTPASVTAQLTALKRSNPTLTFRPPRVLALGTTPAVKATYTTQSAPNPVTGKRVTLIVDRYELANGGRRAVVDLGTPAGVDNVDAYRKMIESFRWR